MGIQTSLDEAQLHFIPDRLCVTSRMHYTRSIVYGTTRRHASARYLDQLFMLELDYM